MRIHAGSVLATVALGACGGGGSTDIQGTLVFAERSDTEIARIISAAGGADMFQAQGQVDQFGDTFDAEACPTVTIDGNTATVTGGCTREDGTMITGSAVVENPAGWDQIDWTGGDSRYELNGLGFATESFAQVYTGFIERRDTFSTWDADLTVESFGITVRSDLYYHCENPQSPSCDLTNSGIELVGVGGALASGTVEIDGQSQVSRFTLRGADRLTVEIAAGCVEWQVEGTDRRSACTN
jgi:hypothetical protein